MSWQLELASELHMADWLWVPADLSAGQRAEWTAEAEETLAQLVQDPDGAPVDRAPVRGMLEAALEVRESSPSALVFLVCPLLAPVGTLCHVTLLASSGDEPWPDEDGLVVQRVSGSHVGDGIQVSTRRTVDEDGVALEMSSVHLVFDDRTTAVMLSLQEGPATVVAAAMPGLAMLMDTLRLVQGEQVFRGVAPSWLPEQETWQLEGSR
jgi:hypothetical protein